MRLGWFWRSGLSASRRRSRANGEVRLPMGRIRVLQYRKQRLVMERSGTRSVPFPPHFVAGANQAVHSVKTRLFHANLPGKTSFGGEMTRRSWQASVRRTMPSAKTMFHICLKMCGPLLVDVKRLFMAATIRPNLATRVNLKPKGSMLPPFSRSGH